MESRAEREVGLRARRKAVVAAAIGNFVEWYDFAIYGYFATVIATLFFPSENRLASLLATFAVFAVAFAIRPLGALVFGHYGDKVGRRNTLAVVVLLMSGATFFIGLLPTYETIGVVAPILLTVARLAQGLSAGGEYGGSTSFIVEYAPEGRRGFYGSWQSFSIGVALAGGSALGAVVTSVASEEALYSWAWRVPFLVALPLGLIGLYLRLRIEDTPHFEAVREAEEVEGAPLLETLRSHGGAILAAIGIVLIGTVMTYVFLTYMPTYLPEVLDVPLSQALTANVVGLVFYTALTPFLGALSDRIGRKPLLFAAAVGALVLTYPCFLLLSQATLPAIVAAHLIFGLLVALYAAPAPAVLSELFPTKVRYSALSLGYSVSASVFGGTSPFIATYLLGATGNDFSPALYVMAGALASLVAVAVIKETARRPLRDA